ncbi:MAG: hypothetical protein JXN60_00965 [Lentisphaerae bacterium]|nr:hypothetical protein [Lentisphaerota bacterium]
MMKHAIVRTIIVAIWLLTLGWLIRFEAFPEYFTRVLDGYKGLVGHDILVSDSWMKILHNDAPVGYTHAHMDIVESDPVKRYQLTYDTYLTLDIAGIKQYINMSMESYLDEMYNLQEFKLSASLQGLLINVKGSRGSGNTYVVHIDAGSLHSKQLYKIPEGVVLYSPMTELNIHKLKPGQQITVLTFDPISLSRISINIRAIRQEQIHIDGITYDATLLIAEYQGTQMSSWVNEKDGVLKQVTPWGWTLIRCSPEEATVSTFKPDNNSRSKHKTNTSLTNDLLRQLVLPNNARDVL